MICAIIITIGPTGAQTSTFHQTVTVSATTAPLNIPASSQCIVSNPGTGYTGSVAVKFQRSNTTVASVLNLNFDNGATAVTSFTPSAGASAYIFYPSAQGTLQFVGTGGTSSTILTIDCNTLSPSIATILPLPVSLPHGGTGVASPNPSWTGCASGSGTWPNIVTNSTACLNTAGGQTVTLLDTFNGGISAGSTGATLTAGDIGASRSTTSGLLNLGGSGSSGYLEYGINYPGEFTFQKNVHGEGFIVAGAATAATLTPGDLGASRSTTTGAVSIGGSSSAVTCDYGVTTTVTLTCNKNLVDTGSITATNSIFSTTGNFLAQNGYVSATATGSGATLSPGDVGAERSSTTGVVWFGGSSSSAECDYGVTTGSILTCSKPLSVTGALKSSTTITAGTAQGCGVITGYHIECGLLNITASCTAGSDCTLGSAQSFTANFTGTPICFVNNANEGATAETALIPYYTTTTSAISIFAYPIVTFTSGSVHESWKCIGV